MLPDFSKSVCCVCLTFCEDILLGLLGAACNGAFVYSVPAIYKCFPRLLFWKILLDHSRIGTVSAFLLVHHNLYEHHVQQALSAEILIGDLLVFINQITGSKKESRTHVKVESHTPL